MLINLFVAVLAFSALVILGWISFIDPRAKSLVLSQDRLGLVTFMTSYLFLVVGILLAAGSIELVFLAGLRLNGVIAIWLGSMAGMGAVYGFLVMLPDEITDKILRRRYLVIYAIPILVLVVIILIATI